MDTFAEPYTRAGDDISLSAVRDHVRALEARHKANGVHLSGRIIHVSHYLPLICTLSSSPTRDGVLSPPPTPPHVHSDVPQSPTEELLASPTSAPPAPHTPRWKLSPRYGHSAMTSGIRSLSETHEQLIVGWTGDVLSPVLAPDGASSPDGHSHSSSLPIPTNLSPQVTSTLPQASAFLRHATAFPRLVSLSRTKLAWRSTFLTTLIRTILMETMRTRNPLPIFPSGWRTTSHMGTTMVIANRVSSQFIAFSCLLPFYFLPTRFPLSTRNEKDYPIPVSHLLYQAALFVDLHSIARFCSGFCQRISI